MSSFVSRSFGTKERLRAARAHADGRNYHQPVRKVIVRSTARILRELSSVKMGCKVPCESSIEYDYYSILDARRDVREFFAQPELLHYLDQHGKWRKHTPDVEVVFTSGSAEIHEVKPDAEAIKPSVQALHQIITEEYARRDQRYQVVLASEVRRQPRLCNAHVLRSTRQRRLSPNDQSRAMQELAFGPVTLEQLEDALGGGVAARLDLLAMVLRGDLDMDWERQPIAPGILVRLPESSR